MIYDVALIDGNNLAYRAYSAHKDLAYCDEPTGLVFGFIQNLIALKKGWMKNNSKIYVVWDKGHDFRSQIYPEYKANRHKKRDEDDYSRFIKQKINLMAILSKLGLYQAYVNGEEADDVVGTLAKKFEKEGKMVLIYSNDHDYYQLISDNVHVLHKVDKKGVSIYDRNSFIAENDLSPELYADVMSLMGDPGDEVPGIHGIGDKTAFKIVRNNPNLVSEIINGKPISAINGVSERIASMVEKGGDVVRLASQLVRIRCDLDAVTEHPNKDMAAVREMFEGWGFKQFLRAHIWSLLGEL